MSYQVIARKWRPQRFDDVVGQQVVTRTLRNALASGRLAHAFVFAGPRGVGKTTTARILARALNCVNGPTAEPCGTCDACIEIAEGRDIDVLEIDAATHTGVDNVREVIIAGLSIMPVRNRYKIFIIDEVQQLSIPSFNALLKSIEEPPPHVVFMMATTELDKIPDTVLSRSQVHEFRAIGIKSIADQLRRIVDAEGIAVDDEALHSIARDAEGSMRDAESKLDQVIAFTGKRIETADVATILGLVGRDLPLDAVQAVADENAPAAFALVERAVEMGYDLRLVCRELSRVVRDLLVLSVDPSRISDPDVASDSDRERLTELVKRFSREDLLRAFDLLTKIEADIRTAAQPRYHLELGLLRWMYVRKLRPIEELISGADSPAPASRPIAAPSTRTGTAVPSRPPSFPAASAAASSTPPVSRAATPTAQTAAASAPAATDAALKDALLEEIRNSKRVFYNTVVAQAQKIEVASDRVTFTFSPEQRVMREAVEQNRAWLESIATRAAGRKISVVGIQNGAQPKPAEAPKPAEEDRKAVLRKEALADSGVQALLEVFPAEIRDVEEIEKG
jgi:DNA polymerase-3 subunit gamma/tau